MARFTKPWRLVLVVLALMLAIPITSCSTAPAATPTTAATAKAATTSAAANTPAAATTSAAAAASKAAPAADPAQKEFYNGKTLTIMVPQKAGGSSDTASRILTKYLTRELGVKVMVENDDAASGRVARNKFFNQVKADGLTLFIEPSGASMGDWAMGTEGISYDITKLNYLGGLPRAPQVLTTSAKGPYKTIQDVMNTKDELKFPGMAPGSLTTLASVAACEILGLKNAKVVPGFTGATERGLALMQGQVQIAIYTMEYSTPQAKEGNMNILAQFLPERDKNYPNIPALGDIVKLTDYHRSLLAAIMPDITQVEVPPGTPAERVQYLRGVFSKIFADKEFQAEYTKAMGDWLGPMTGDDILKIANGVAKDKPSFVKAYDELNKKYLK
jgi:tripartite-type tricarboxylate transporter receptor subunit TctC